MKKIRRKNRILSVIIVLALTLCIMPAINMKAFAQQEEENTPLTFTNKGDAPVTITMGYVSAFGLQYKYKRNNED